MQKKLGEKIKNRIQIRLKFYLQRLEDRYLYFRK